MIFQTAGSSSKFLLRSICSVGTDLVLNSNNNEHTISCEVYSTKKNVQRCFFFFVEFSVVNVERTELTAKGPDGRIFGKQDKERIFIGITEFMMSI